MNLMPLTCLLIDLPNAHIELIQEFGSMCLWLFKDAGLIPGPDASPHSSPV